MDNTLILELYTFLTSIYGGLMGGFTYDLYRTIRHYSKPKKIKTYIEDLLFWVIITLLCFYILIRSNYGEIRGYIILGIILGAYVYIKTLSKLIYPILIKISKFILKTSTKATNIIKYPFINLKKNVSPKIKKMRDIPAETWKEIKKYKNIISKKK